MVRIGGSTPEGEHIKEWDYYTPSGEFRYGNLLKDAMILIMIFIAGLMVKEAAPCLIV